MLAVIAVAELLGMSLWFTASAGSAHLRELWGLDAGAAGWLTGAVQLGFVVGTALAAVLNLADLWPARFYFAGSAFLAALANGALAVAPDYPTALGLRFATGVFLAGVYPPSLKMAATWFKEGRGLAVGSVVGALTVGKATPYLMLAFASSFTELIAVSSAGAALAAILVLAAYRDGPHAFRRQPFSWSLAGVVVRHRPTRLAVGGYLGHMWELYAMWTWIPTFLAASVALYESRHGVETGAWVDGVIAFGAIAAGGLGCVWGGWVADRVGRARLVNRAMAISGVCSLGVGFVFGLSPWIVVPVVLVWGFFVVADSAQFSTLVTEVSPPHAVGTALTLQTSLGFLLTMVTIQLVPEIAAAAGPGDAGWRWAFPILALGPGFGIWAISRLRKEK